METYFYAFKESFRLCFNSSKSMTITYLVMKGLLTILPSFQILYLSNLINSIGIEFENIDSILSLNLFLLVIVIMLSWLSKSSQLSILECLKIKIKEEVSPVFTKKRTNLCLDTLESEKTNEMIHRVSSEIEINICNAFEATIGLVMFIFQVSCILYILMQQVWWIGVLTT